LALAFEAPRDSVPIMTAASPAKYADLDPQLRDALTVGRPVASR
jgi:hypothetical protein